MYLQNSQNQNDVRISPDIKRNQEYVLPQTDLHSWQSHTHKEQLWRMDSEFFYAIGKFKKIMNTI